MDIQIRVSNPCFATTFDESTVLPGLPSEIVVQTHGPSAPTHTAGDYTKFEDTASKT